MKDRAVRELDGSFASFRQADDWVTDLDDASLALRFRNVSSVYAKGARQTVLEARFEGELETGADRVRVTVDALQTEESYGFEASVELNGRRYFSRSWELALAAGATALGPKRLDLDTLRQ